MREYHQQIVDWLKIKGATSIVVDPTHKHTHIKFQWRGEPKLYVAPTTPGDMCRGLDNAFSTLRHILGLVKQGKTIGVRRKTPVISARKRPVETPTLSDRPDWRDVLKARHG